MISTSENVRTHAFEHRTKQGTDNGLGNRGENE
jgi:hypothetical protein